MKDALGNEVIIGNTYGYSRSNNGLTNIKVGRIIKFNKKSVTMEVEIAKTALYNDDPTDIEIEKPFIQVKSNTLFPLRMLNVDNPPEFLYKNNGELTFAYHDDVDVWDDWKDYVKEINKI